MFQLRFIRLRNQPLLTAISVVRHHQGIHSVSGTKTELEINLSYSSSETQSVFR